MNDSKNDLCFSVSHHYVTKVEEKSRTIEELHQVMMLTGFIKKITRINFMKESLSKNFFQKAILNKNCDAYYWL